MATSLLTINMEELKRREIKGIIIDLDNTIIPWDSSELPSDIFDCLQHWLDNGLKICLLSNNTRKRVEQIATTLKIPYVYRAFKPANSGFNKALSLLNLSSAEAAVIGDQLFTDILGGNRLGLFTIWVAPLANQEFIGTKVTRKIERFAVRILRKKGILQ